MDNWAEIFLGLGILLTLAGIGISTLVAFALMAAIGFITEMSFRRVFFLSFGIALLPTLLLGGILIGALQDDEVQAEINTELRESLPLPSEYADELQRIEREGDFDSEELERRIEELIPGSDVQIDSDGFRITTSEDEAAIEVDPSEGQ